jgi:hypothetical protein
MGRLAPLSRAQRRTLARLSRFLRERGLYLAGGVAVAFHRHHRRSMDLDFFSLHAPLDLVSARDELVLHGIPLEVVSLTDASLRLRIADTPVGIVSYPYELLTRPVPGPEGVLVASVRDLATMKLAAVAQRRIYRDFWDLRELLTGGLSLQRSLSDYATRYGAARSDLYHVLRALTYFEDAERTPTLPAGLTRRHWREIRAWFEERAAASLRRLMAKR